MTAVEDCGASLVWLALMLVFWSIVALAVLVSASAAGVMVLGCSVALGLVYAPAKWWRL